MNWVFLDFIPWEFDVGTPLVRPLGGSQSAMCYLATALARRGERVTTLTGTKQAKMVQGVRCLPYENIPTEVFSPQDTVTIVLNGPANMVHDIRAVIPKGKPLILWTQHAYDQPAMQSLREAAVVAKWDRIVCISNWQKQTFQQELGVPLGQMDVMRNAIGPTFANLFQSAEQLAQAKAGQLRLAYTSTPFRGLDVLIVSYPPVQNRHPNARLDIFSSMQVYGQPSGEDPYRALYDRCRTIPGIVYRGSVSQTELARELAQTSVLAYPNTFAETSCIAVMEALAAGLAVVTSDLGALPETCAGWAKLIPPVGPGRTPESFAIDFARTLDQVLMEIETNPAGVMQRQFEQAQAINRTCNWDARAEEWMQMARGWLAN
jgi:glycosyltransferase involved in cell wall biosynthesis